MKNLFKTWLILPLLALFISPSIGQKNSNTEKEVQMPKIAVENGMIQFQSMQDMDQLYRYLSVLEATYVSKVETDSQEEYTEEDQFLVAFEESIGFKNSMRTKTFNQKRDVFESMRSGRTKVDLNAEVDFEDQIDDQLIYPDKIFQTILNRDNAFMLNGQIFIMKDVNYAYRINDGNMNTYNLLVRGGDPSTKNLGNISEVEYTGNTSDDVQAKGGGDGWEVLIDWFVEWLKKCHARFTYSENAGTGQVNFHDNSVASQTAGDFITSWHWDFGDGTTSTQQNPSHTFPCDNKWKVKLTITCAMGCTSSRTRRVKTSIETCCKANVSTYYTHGLSSNYRLKLRNYHVQLGISNVVVARVKHQKKFGWAGWWRKKTSSLKSQAIGNVYLRDATGCYCEIQQNISGSKTRTNASICRYRSHLGIQEYGFKMKISDRWKARYYVNGSFKKELVSSGGCD